MLAPCSLPPVSKAPIQRIPCTHIIAAPPSPTRQASLFLSALQIIPNQSSTLEHRPIWLCSPTDKRNTTTIAAFPTVLFETISTTSILASSTRIESNPSTPGLASNRTHPAAMSGPNNVDMDALLDLSEYDGIPSYNSPSLSPSTTSKPTFASPITTAVTTPSMTTTQALSGPSHNYDMYRQQTGFVPGAIANTMAVNESNNAGYQDFGSLDYLTGFPSENDMFDFNTSPSQATLGASDIMDFGSPADSQLFPTVNPSNIEQDSALASPSLSSQASGVGRLWPGAHSQAAMAKAHAQQRQQQHIIQQQQAQRQPMQTKARAGKAPQPSDPIVEQKITQLLNSMRAKPAPPASDASSPMTNLNRARKDDEEMDEDERLLASEEGKKLSSKERRQLRNKVSARAFRSRRKGKMPFISPPLPDIFANMLQNTSPNLSRRLPAKCRTTMTCVPRTALCSRRTSAFLISLACSFPPLHSPASWTTSAQTLLLLPRHRSSQSPSHRQSSAQSRMSTLTDRSPLSIKLAWP